MKKGEVLFRFTEVTDKMPAMKLGPMNQIRNMIKTLTRDPAERFNASNLVSNLENTLTANLSNFFLKVTEKLKNGLSDDVLVAIPSKYEIVYNDVISSQLFKPYYDFHRDYPDTKYNGIKYTIRVLIQKKGSTK